MLCERCKKEIRPEEEQTIQLGGQQVVIPFHERCIKEIQAESDEWDKKHSFERKSPHK